MVTTTSSIERASYNSNEKSPIKKDIRNSYHDLVELQSHSVSLLQERVHRSGALEGLQRQRHHLHLHVVSGSLGSQSSLKADSSEAQLAVQLIKALLILDDLQFSIYLIVRNNLEDCVTIYQ